MLKVCVLRLSIAPFNPYSTFIARLAFTASSPGGTVPEHIFASPPGVDLLKLTTNFLVLPWLIAILSAHGQAPDAPSFDCKKARSASEKTICGDAELSRMDRELAELYRAARAAAKDPQAFRQAAAEEWRIREESCRDRGCLIQWYQKRKLQLAANANTTPVTEIASSTAASSKAAAALPAHPAPAPAIDVPFKPPVSANTIPAPPSAEDPNVLAGKLIAGKQEYAAASAMVRVGGSVALTSILQGMMGTDSFGDKPWCLVSLPGLSPDAAKTVGKWRLVYRREKAKGEDKIFTGSWEGASAPPRVSFDEESSFINAPDAALPMGNPEFAKRLTSAKTITLKHNATFAVVYDAQQLRMAQAIARKACP